MHSALYIGWVSHRRRTPRPHAFRYPLFMAWLDLAELGQVFRGRWLWGMERRALASFYRADHFGEPSVPLERCVRDLVEAETGRRPLGPIRLLTHLRYFGYCFNPVSFYYCYDTTDREIVAVVAEVTNTPWGERHCYVLDAAVAQTVRGVQHWRSDKRMHVSPFMPMNLQYEWRLAAPSARLLVHMRCVRAGQALFDATLSLRRRALRAPTMAATLWRFPWMTARVLAAIHWQALRLWLKRVPYYPHPVARSGATNTTGPVGLPVGEPPTGSTLTAICSARASARRWVSLNASEVSPRTGITPSDTAASPAGRAHSS